MVNHRARRNKNRQPRVSRQSQDTAVASVSSDVGNLFQPTRDQVMKAIESLYADGLKPVGRILRKRIAEIAADCSEEHVDIEHALAICKDSDLVKIVEEEGGDWAALLLDRPESYVNIHSPEDSFLPQMWADFSAYVSSLAGDEARLPGGRYACALALQKLELPFFEGRSLGELSHIVQLAISQKILGYSNNELVAYANSVSRKKEECAKNAKAFTQVSQVEGVSIRVADWDSACGCLRMLLDSSPEGMVPLSNLKRLVRERFRVELSETKLGYAKLCDLLRDHRFADICIVKLQKCGYFVFQVMPQERGIPSSCDNLHDAQFGNAARETVAQRSIGKGPRTCEFLQPLTLDLHDGIYLEASPSPSGSLSGCESDESTVDSARGTSAGGFNFPPTPSPCLWHPCSVEDEPRRITAPQGLGVHEVFGDVELQRQTSPHELSMARWASDLPCTLSCTFGIATKWPSPLSSPLATAPTWPRLSPAASPKNKRIGSTCVSKIRNTFIHSPLPLPTPLRRSSARRARSLPKNLGSNKDAWHLEPEPELIDYGNTPYWWHSPACASASNTRTVISISGALPPNLREPQSRIPLCIADHV